MSGTPYRLMDTVGQSSGLSDVCVLDTLTDLTAHTRTQTDPTPEFNARAIQQAVHQRYRLYVTVTEVRRRLVRLVEHGYVRERRRTRESRVRLVWYRVAEGAAYP